MKGDQKEARCLAGLLRDLYHRIEAAKQSRIHQAIMAERLGISSCSYMEYLRSTNALIGVRVILVLLCMLDARETSEALRHLCEGRENADKENGEN